MAVCGRLLVVRFPWLVVCGRSWLFADGLWLIVVVCGRLWLLHVLVTTFNVMYKFQCTVFCDLIRRKKSRHKISLVKKIVSRKFCHWQDNSSLFTDEFFCLAI